MKAWIEEADGSLSKERSGINERFLPGIDTSTRLFALSHRLERTILEYLAIANILAGPVNRRKHFTLSKCWLHSLRLSAVCRFVSTALRWNTVSGDFNEAPRRWNEDCCSSCCRSANKRYFTDDRCMNITNDFCNFYWLCAYNVLQLLLLICMEEGWKNKYLLKGTIYRVTKYVIDVIKIIRSSWTFMTNNFVEILKRKKKGGPEFVRGRSCLYTSVKEFRARNRAMPCERTVKRVLCHWNDKHPICIRLSDCGSVKFPSRVHPFYEFNKQGDCDVRDALWWHRGNRDSPSHSWADPGTTTNEVRYLRSLKVLTSNWIWKFRNFPINSN